MQHAAGIQFEYTYSGVEMVAHSFQLSKLGNPGCAQSVYDLPTPWRYALNETS